MKMLNLLRISTLVFIINSTTFAQKYELVKELSIVADFVKIDAISKLHFVKNDNEIVTYDIEKDKEIFTYSNKRSGKISTLDITNPLNILAFSAEYQQITILDRTLNPTATYSLLDYNINQCAAISIANENNIWIFDAIKRQLYKFSTTSKSLDVFDYFRYYLKDDEIPNQMVFSDNNFYLNIKGKFVLKLDMFGTIEKKIPVLANQIAVNNGRLIYQHFQNKEWFSYKELSTNDLKIFPSAKIESLDFNKNYLVTKMGEKVFIYKFSE
jgi:hypothetical protein